MNHGREISSFLSAHGVDGAYLNHASEFIKNAHHMAVEAKKENSYIDELLSNLSAYEQSVGTTMIASVLAHAMGLNSESPVKIVGMAALLHNVGLLRLPAELHSEDENQMTASQLALYRTHPISERKFSKGKGC